MQFDTIKALLEAISNADLYKSEHWKTIERNAPRLAKDFKLYLDKHLYDKFVEYVDQVIDANHAGKTGGMFPKLDLETWTALLHVTQYMTDEDATLKRHLSNGKVSYEVRESLEALADRIAEIIEG